jgi:23S rRNA pseudouridine1911/1915/1917 synthase
MLSQGRVCLNGEPCKIADRKVHPGDSLEIGARRSPTRLPAGLEILYEDHDIVVIHKPVGLLTVATTDEREKTAYAFLRRYLKDRNPRQRLFIVHRLDKFASGILVFAKSDNVKSILQGVFSRHEIQRKYWAIVEGRVEKEKGTIRSHLAQNKSLRMHSTGDKSRGKPAVTHYRVLHRLPRLSVLEVTLETGRKNQIRAHLSEMGHPIVGDRAYGSSQDPLGRLGLHAFQLGFSHPIKGVPLLFQTEPPPEFARYMSGRLSRAVRLMR